MKRVPTLFNVGPMFSGGPDGAAVPDGFSRVQRNMLQRPRRWAMRPPCIYDNVSSAAGSGLTLVLIGLWDDLANNTTRLVAWRSNQQLYVKDVGAETWTAGPSTAPVSVTIADVVSHRGIFYLVAANGKIYSYNGTNLAPSGSTRAAPFPSNITAASICTAIDRVVLGNTSAALINLICSKGNTYPYDLTLWSATSVDTRTIGTGAGSVCQIIPTVTTGACKVELADVVSITLPAYDSYYTFRSDIQSADATADTPLTLEVYLSSKWAALTAYTVGTLRVSLAGGTLAGFRFRVVTAGTSAAAEPAWSTTVGATTADGTVTWICDGSDAFGSTPVDLPSASVSASFQANWCIARLPSSTNAGTVNLGVRIKFGNLSATTWTKAGVVVSYRDGLTDGDPRKANKGQQLTTDAFPYPFYNVETSNGATVTLYDVMYSEPLNVADIEPENFLRIPQLLGPTTAVRCLDRSLFVFKRKGSAVYQGNPDPDIPFAFQQTIPTGCLAPSAIDIHNGVMYFIGEDDVYRWSPGGLPEPLCGDAMREEIMNRSSATWVENQTYAKPLLQVHQKDREVWVYTQKGKIYVYDVDGKHNGLPGWSYLDIQGATESLQVSSLTYFPTTQKMYVGVQGWSTNAEIRRFEPAITTGDTDGNGAAYNVTARTTFRPLEKLGAREDLLVEEVGVHHACSLSQAGQSTTVYISLDQGVTFPYSSAVTLRTSASAIRDPIDVWQSGPSIDIAVEHIGAAGEGNFNLSQLDATVQDDGEEFPQHNPTPGATTL